MSAKTDLTVVVMGIDKDGRRKILRQLVGPKRQSSATAPNASVDSIDTALRRVCAKAEVSMPFLSVYSFRHRVVSVLRASKSPYVPSEQISYQLGHRRHSAVLRGDMVSTGRST